MTSPSRSTYFTKLHRVLKKHYKPVAANAERPVLEHLVFACLLEDTQYDVAEEAFAAIVEEYFDWNEIRVSSVRELTETMARLPDPPTAANRLKQVLQHVFEASYSFDLEELRKKNLGPAAEALKKIEGTTRFTVSYVVQSALGGHSIPLDSGALEIMRIVGLATEEEIANGSISGLERAIPKSKGIEFGSLLHQLGADLVAGPFAAELRNKLLEIEPAAKTRWPKRRTGRSTAVEKTEEAKKVADETKPGKKKKKSPVSAEKEAKPVSTKRKKTASAAKKAPPKKKTTTKKTASTKRKTASSKTKSRSESTGRKRTSSGLSKRKPR